MTLDKLEITGFGKFSNAVIDLQSGLDAREYPNEFGKSTLADFIVFCFYGFEKSRAKKPLRDNQPEKYRPWNQNGAVGGAIEFHTDAGRRYCLERSCDAKGKSKAQIVDESGAVQDIEDAGQYFFGVDRETFLNIFFMRGSGCAPIRTEQTEIAMKNLVVTGDETVSYDSVMQVLQNERSKYVSAKRGMGKLRDLQGHIQDLQTQIVLSENKIEEQARRRPSAEQDERTLKTLEQKIQRLEDINQIHKARAAFQREQKREALHRQIVQEEGLPQSAFSQEEYQLVSRYIAQNERTQALLEQAKADLLALSASPVTLSKDAAVLLETPVKNSRRPIWLGMAGIGIITAAAGFALAPWNFVAGGILLAAGLILCFADGSLPAPLRKIGIHNKKEWQAAYQRALSDKQAAEEYQTRLASLRAELAAKQAAADAAAAEAEPVLKRAGVFTRGELDRLYAAQIELGKRQQRLRDAREALEELADSAEADKHIARDLPAPELTPAGAEEQWVAAQREKAILLKARADHAVEARELLEEQRRLAQLQDDLANAQADCEAMQSAVEIIDIAAAGLEAAQQQLQNSYAPILQRALSEKTKQITAGKYDTVIVDPELNIYIKADGAVRPLGYFSTGTADAVYVALRFALAKIVEKEETVPFIMDDPFLSFDAQRLQKVSQMLKTEGQTRQILYLSCKNEEL